MLSQKYKDCVEACQKCASVCNDCATDCLHESDVQMLQYCIQLNLECSVICRCAAEMMSLNSKSSDEVCAICSDFCTACAEECEKHASKMDHCRVCAETCRECAEVCKSMALAGVEDI